MIQINTVREKKRTGDEKDQDRYGRKAYTEVEVEEYRVTANMVIPWLFGRFAVSNPATFGLEYQLMPESRPDSNTGAGRRSTLRHTLWIWILANRSGQGRLENINLLAGNALVSLCLVFSLSCLWTI